MKAVLFDPRLLTYARCTREMTMSTLAKKIGKSQQLISKIEDDIISPSNEVLSSIADVLNYPIAKFYSDKPTLPIHGFNRHSSEISKRNYNRILSYITFRKNEIETLLSSIDINVRLKKWYLCDENVSPKVIANRVRDCLQIPNGSIPNLIQTLESSGIILFGMEFGNIKQDGFSVDNGFVPMIFYNKNNPMDRIRFAIAHELGHIVMHRYYREANEFAAEFLMPSMDIKRDLKALTPEKLINLKKKWRTSMSSILMKAHALKQISDKEKQRLFVWLSKNGYSCQEPYEPTKESPTLVSKLIECHINELQYSIDELSQLVKLKQSEFEEIYIGIKRVYFEDFTKRKKIQLNG